MTPHASQPAPASPPPSSTAAALAPHLEREIGRTVRTLTRLRALLTVTLAGLILLFVAFGAEAWRTAFVAGALVPLIAVSWHDLRWLRHHAVTRRFMVYVYATVVVFQAVFVAATGGVQSPLLLIFAPPAIIAAVSLGKARAFALAVLLPVGIVWGFALGHMAGLLPDLRPALFCPAGAAPLNGAWLWIYATAVTFVMLIGGSLGLLVRSTLDRAAATATLARQEALQTMQDRNRELIQLAGALAHELKNPLASIQGLAGLLVRHAPDGSREAERTGVLLAEARRMGAVLDEFLNFSRPVDGLAVAAVDPGRLVQDVVQLHEGLAAERGVRLETDLRAQAPLAADPRKLQQVLVNLVQNALDAAPRGSTVTVRAAGLSDGSTAFTVEDEGPGIAEALRGRLFTPGATSKAAGSGLGLVIARAIVEQHGGSLALENRPQGGCCARCTLPRQAPAQPSEAP